MQNEGRFVIAIHGGAGNLVKRNFSAEQDSQYRNSLDKALTVGYSLLENGEKATEVVEAVIKILEDDSLFNAGKGSVFTHDGKNEMDAAIMNGETLKAGCVSGLRRVKNPISAAKSIMDNSQFIFLSGEGAEQFAQEHNIEMVDTSYFFTQYRWQQLMKIRETEKTELDHEDHGYLNTNDKNEKYGTVGCVVLDKYGNLSAGTSTGGIVNKMYGRVGDSPIIGAGTYANNKTCAVSCTGHGEDFIRLVAAYDVSARMEYKGENVNEAAENVIYKIRDSGGRGGIIAIDKNGNVALPFSTTGMFRAYVKKGEKRHILIYNESQ